MDNDKLIECTVEITKAAVSEAGEKTTHVLNNAGDVAKFMDTVYSKLAELNERAHA